MKKSPVFSGVGFAHQVKGTGKRVQQIYASFQS
jgi:hypothetical protein